MLIAGMYPSRAGVDTPLLIQPNSIDSLEPRYSCPAASALFSDYGVGSSATNWTRHLNASSSLFARLDGVSGIDPDDNGWHQSFDHYFDNLSARLCHQKTLPCSVNDTSACISRSDADTVFRMGEYEYSFIYRDAPQSLAVSVGSYGVWVAELAANLRSAMKGKGSVKYRHNVAHDGSISRLLSILQIEKMVWPGMGSEVVFEMYSKEGCFFLRVLWGGQVLRSSHPAFAKMDMVPLSTFLAYVDGLVGEGAKKVPGLCEASEDDE
ncbi:Putative histidine phosphatase superfamily [Septoria linicola]|uniref:Histidine phosphatase superfamily n=1 Tax=Septoria linicola TaxID=215465 RepID=A0A9Q9AZT9_9PEZI|nr:Putative histidine phosphatase superfamily [Septoria linicola]